MNEKSSPNRKNSLWGLLALGLAAFIWGTAFVAQSVGMEHLEPFTFNGVRSLIGSAVLAPLAVGLSRRQREGRLLPAEKAARRKWLWLGGGACGLVLAVATNLQQIGLKTVAPGKAGFLTALYIVIVPLLGLFTGRRLGWKVWSAVAVALAGTWLLSVRGNFTIASGDLLVIFCAAVFSVHIVVVDYVSPRVSGVALSCVQFLVAGLLSVGVALWRESPAWSDLLAAAWPLLYAGVLSSGVAYTLQILGQKTVEPAVASMVMSLESVFAALAGWVVLGTPLLPRELAGCVLVFGAVVLAQLPEKPRNGAP